jgi:hypothetical protein
MSGGFADDAAADLRAAVLLTDLEPVIRGHMLGAPLLVAIAGALSYANSAPISPHEV